MGETKIEIDPMTLSVLWNRLRTIDREIGDRVGAASQSFVLAVIRDYAPTLFDSKNRILLVEDYIPAHTTGSQFAQRATVEEYRGRIYPGDAFIGNDPYTTRGGHLPDWSFLRPVFYKGELQFWTFLRGHVLDSGGAYSGSYAPRCYDIHAEGFIMPPLKVIEKGEIVRDVYRLILSNVRAREIMHMDIMCIFSALEKAENRLIELCDKYGIETVNAVIDEVINRTEKAMREFIRKIPEGTYRGESSADWDGTVDRPVTVRVTITVKHRPKPHMILDFSESDDQVSFINLPLGQLYASAFCAIFMVTAGRIPRNEGAYKPFEIIAPEGKCVNAKYPATVGACGCILGVEVIEAIFKALGQAIPKETPAMWTRHVSPIIVGKDARKIDPRTGKFPELFISCFWSDGGSGAIYGYDGWNALGGVQWAGQVQRASVEWAEIVAPIRLLHYGIHRDSEGAGKWRGAFGTHVEFEITASAGPGTIFIATGNSDGEKFETFGQMGGGSGKKYKGWIVKRGGERIRLRTLDIVEVEAGDRIVTFSGGGGGVGNPLERDPERVRADVMNGYLSVERAKEVYGVIINPKTFEIEGTTRRRDFHLSARIE